MLQLRPTCEQCAAALPPDAVYAMICSYECTFCSDCVENVLANVCPNCGGGFCPRPVRPVSECRDGVCLRKHPAAKTITHKPLGPELHREFANSIKHLAPEKR